MTTEQINRSVEKEFLVLRKEDKFTHYWSCLVLLIFPAVDFWHFFSTSSDMSFISEIHVFSPISILLSAGYFVIQTTRLRMSSIKTNLTQTELKTALTEMAASQGWKFSSPHKRAFKATTTSNLSRGDISEFVTIIFDRNRVLVNSINNPFIGSWLFGLGRNKRNVETVTKAITEAAFNKAKAAADSES